MLQILFSSVPDMFKSLTHELYDMIIIERIPGFLAFLAKFYQPCCPEYTQLVGNGRLSHLKCVRNITDTHLTGRQECEQLDACRVAQHLEDFSEPQARCIVNFRKPCFLDAVRVCVVYFAKVIVSGFD